MKADDWVKIIAAIGVIIAGGFAVKLIVNRKQKQNNITNVTQKNNTIRGDNAGRDINKN